MAAAPAPAPTPPAPTPTPGAIPSIPASPTPAGTAPGTAAPFSDAQAQINAQNRATLQMLTGAQTGGTSAYTAAQTAGQADKGTAIQQLLASAIFHGAPGAAIPAGPNAAATAAGTVGGAYDQRIGTTGDLSAAFNAAMGTREQGASDYFKEASAAVPVIEAQTNQRIATAHAAAQAKAVQDALDMQLKQVGLQTAYAGLAKAQASAGSGTGPGGYSDVNKVIASLGGAQLAGQSFNAQATEIGQQIRQQTLAHQQAQSGANAAAGAGTGPSGTGGGNFDPGPSQADIDAQAYAQIDAAYGLPPGTAQDLATQAESATLAKGVASQNAQATLGAKQNAAPSTSDLRASADYKSAVDDLATTAANPTYNYNTFVTRVYPALVARYGPDIARQVVADNPALIPAKPSNPNTQP